MIELKRAGLYIANGKRTSVLIRVAGEAPMLDIVSGVLLNDMEKDGTVTVLDKGSIELQDILSNPKDYVFDFPAVGEAIKNEKGIEVTSNKLVEYTEDTFREWIDKYKEYRQTYPENCDIKIVLHIMKTGGFSKSQSDLILKQIKTRIRIMG